MTKAENNILLFSITLCWAASYIFMKNLPEDFSSFAYLALTTGIAAVLMAMIFFRQLRQLAHSTLKKGFVLSLILSVNLLAEKKGVSMLDSANASFLAALSILFVPLLLLILFHNKPEKNHVLGAAIILCGLCVSTGFTVKGFFSAGTLYMLMGTLCSAIYTIAVDRYAKEENPLLICIVQMFFTALTGFLLWYMENPETFRSVAYTKELLSNIVILAFFAKAYAYIVLMFSQKYTDALSVTVIASTEPVVTLVLAVLLPVAYGGNQRIGGYTVAGAVLIAAGAVVAGLHFLDPKRNGQEENCHET